MEPITKTLKIGGMTCVNCQNRIERKLRDTSGVINAKVSYGAGKAAVTYNPDVVTLKDIAAVIKKMDYQVLTRDRREEPRIGRAIGLLIIIVSLYMLLEMTGVLNLLVPSRLADSNMAYGMLFVVGLLTSVHCTAMCGGINLSQCIPRGGRKENGSWGSTVRPAFLYNLGRVVSYTAIGFIVGALGSAFSVSPAMQGVLKMLAGLIMIIMGINMLGIFPWLRWLSPSMPKVFARKIDMEKEKSQNLPTGFQPFYVGLLNGLMPCGPLQAMQIYALSTGSAMAGAFSMLLFSLGTVPLMFGLGALSSALGGKFTRKVMTAGAVLVAALGLSMLSQGWNLSGGSSSGVLSAQTNQSAGDTVNIDNGVQVVNSTLASGRYPAITVQAGIPVKWVIDAPQGSINGCNNRVLIQEYGIEYPFKTGENIIEFTPRETGNFTYTCWMGMIRGSITVVEGDAAAS
ncbi:MAG: sulfite exporter TauE/SafE family protein [Clostridiales bacterium]|jgi:sulfite exporter TauE/SafE/copper chaperone CopZ|nr:sulfite exporter TauE/SafE family protein [Clostridiales bacterium]